MTPACNAEMTGSDRTGALRSRRVVGAVDLAGVRAPVRLGEDQMVGRRPGERRQDLADAFAEGRSPGDAERHVGPDPGPDFTQLI